MDITDGQESIAPAVREVLEAAAPLLEASKPAEAPDCQACAAADVCVMTHLPHICEIATREASKPAAVDREALEQALSLHQPYIDRYGNYTHCKCGAGGAWGGAHQAAVVAALYPKATEGKS